MRGRCDRNLNAGSIAGFQVFILPGKRAELTGGALPNDQQAHKQADDGEPASVLCFCSCGAHGWNCWCCRSGETQYTVHRL